MPLKNNLTEQKAQTIVEYAVILTIILTLVGVFFGHVKDTFENYQRSSVNTMAGG